MVFKRVLARMEFQLRLPNSLSNQFLRFEQDPMYSNPAVGWFPLGGRMFCWMQRPETNINWLATSPPGVRTHSQGLLSGHGGHWLSRTCISAGEGVLTCSDHSGELITMPRQWRTPSLRVSAIGRGKHISQSKPIRTALGKGVFLSGPGIRRA